MRKFQKTVLKLLITSLAAVTISSCKEEGIKIPFIQFERVKEFTRDSLHTYLEYGDQYGRLTLIQYHVRDVIKSNSGVAYTSLGMICTIDTLMYNVKLDATIGGSRAIEISAKIGNAVVYYVEYQYDVSGRLSLAKIIKPDEGSEEWISYKYNADNIEINEGGTIYSIPLSTEENTGYVCNVYAFAEAPLTNKYIINPELYFLNIYGAPVEKLPAGQTIERVGSNDNRLSRVGKYYYKY
jgi:hypothetical protein